MGEKRRHQVVWLLLFFGLIAAGIGSIGYVVFLFFGLSSEVFLLYLASVGLLAILIGYLWVRLLLQPLLERNRSLDWLLKETLHELNIPIATMQANVDLLEISLQEPKQVKRLLRIRAASERLLYQYRYLEHAIREEIADVEKEEFDVAEAVRENIEHFQYHRPNSQVETDLESFIVYLDRIGFSKVILNLLDNAAKYSPEGTNIRVALHNGCLSVQDEGNGMDEIERLKVYERFFQADKSSEGYGVGLAYVGWFCSENTIPIHLDSQSGEGSEFRLDLSQVKV